MKNEFFWMQKNDKLGNTIAFINKAVADASVVAKKIMGVDTRKEVVLAQKDNFKVLQYSSFKLTTIMLDGVIQEKDDLGRQIGFALLKEMTNQEVSSSDILKMKDDVVAIMQKINCQCDGDVLKEIVNDAAISYQGDVKNVFRKYLTSKKVLGGLITVIVLLLLLLFACGKNDNQYEQLSAEVHRIKADLSRVQSTSEIITEGLKSIVEELNQKRG
jgi:hypothetical protein